MATNCKARTCPLFSTPLATKRDVIASVTTGYGGATAGSFTANYDLTKGGRRTGQKSWSAATANDGSWSWQLGLGQGYSTQATFDSYNELSGVPTPTWSGTAGTESLAARNFGWTYDLAGNRQTETYGSGATTTAYTPNNVNQYSAITGSFAESGLAYDDDGNLTQDATWQYHYDAENRLYAMNKRDGTMDLAFTYDHLGRRIRKVVSSGTTTLSDTKYLWFGWKLVAELAANGTTVNRAYIWGPDFSDAQGSAGGAGALLAQIDGSTVTYAMPDVFGNLAGYLNGTGSLVVANEFTAFGRVLKTYAAAGYVAANYPFGYAGQYTDSETGLVYYGMRYYNPKHGRFINRDPIEEEGGNNIYGFCRNRPLSLWDVLGNIPYSERPEWLPSIVPWPADPKYQGSAPDDPVRNTVDSFGQAVVKSPIIDGISKVDAVTSSVISDPTLRAGVTAGGLIVTGTIGLISAPEVADAAAAGSILGATWGGLGIAGSITSVTVGTVALGALLGGDNQMANQISSIPTSLMTQTGAAFSAGIGSPYPEQISEFVEAGLNLNESFTDLAKSKNAKDAAQGIFSIGGDFRDIVESGPTLLGSLQSSVFAIKSSASSGSGSSGGSGGAWNKFWAWVKKTFS